MSKFKEIFEANPELEVIYITSDGVPFTSQASAQWHKTNRLGGKGEIEVVQNQETEAEAAKPLTKAELRDALKPFGVEFSAAEYKKVTAARLQEILDELVANQQDPESDTGEEEMSEQTEEQTKEQE